MSDKIIYKFIFKCYIPYKIKFQIKYCISKINESKFNKQYLYISKNANKMQQNVQLVLDCIFDFLNFSNFYEKVFC